MRERLNRVVADLDWVGLVPNFEIKHLEFWGSDHRVLEILLDSRTVTRATIRKPFQFEPWWLRDEECHGVISNTWQGLPCPDSPTNLLKGLNLYGEKLYRWGAKKFGSVPCQIRKVQLQLEVLREGDRSIDTVTRIRERRRSLIDC